MRAEKGSGLEAFFAAQDPIRSPPPGFESQSTLRLAAVGDLMDHPYLAQSRDLYGSVEDVIFGADISMANLECVVVDQTVRLEIDATSKSGPPLTMSLRAFETIASRYTLLATASNHSIDLGERGVVSTIAAIRNARIAFHGVNEHASDGSRATLLERNGLSVGVIAHTFGVNGHRKPTPWIVNHTPVNRAVDEIDFRVMQEQFADCRQRRADFVIVQLHWGMEFELFPRKAQLDVAHHIAELGADAIIGHHPHIVQPMETYRTRRDPDRLVPIFYSLGNLTTPFAIDYMRRSGVAQLELAKGRASDGSIKTLVARANIDLVEQHVDGAQIRLRAFRHGDILAG
jgi:poly-gamma-glutamate synthesis protein (capsule biosynthesis protein)